MTLHGAGGEDPFGGADWDGLPSERSKRLYWKARLRRYRRSFTRELIRFLKTVAFWIVFLLMAGCAIWLLFKMR